MTVMARDGGRADQPRAEDPVRTLVVWCHDWPVIALGGQPDQPSAVVFANRVVACSPQARAHGVAVGQRRREAQGRCPDLDVLERDESREARAFEVVVRAVEAFTPRIELTRPGACAFVTRGPARYFGGDHSLAAQLFDAVDAVLAAVGWPGCAQIGVADGPFAATLAARRSDAGIVVIPPGETPAFLAPLPVAVLASSPHAVTPLVASDLVAVFFRLGLATLADLGALESADVVARFGRDGAYLHRLARGLDNRPPDARDPPPDLEVTTELDPPADRVDRIAFLAKVLADDLFRLLEARGLSCTRVLIAAETENGETIERAWRHEGTLTAGAITDRVRWQLDGWLNGAVQQRPTGGVTFLRLAPDEVVPAHGRQLGFWGGETEADVRAARALARVQGLLGPDAVAVPEWRGRRGPGEQLVLVPVAAVDLTAPRPATRRDWIISPWPGHLPAPAPAVIPVDAPTALVVDADDEPVTVSGRALISAAPVRVSIDGGPWRDVTGWAGPWPADERWWDPDTHRRRARFQIILDGQAAHLLTLEAGLWTIEASYD